jgi:hypothetical protein
MVCGQKVNGAPWKSVDSFDVRAAAQYPSLWRPEVPVVIDGNNLLYAARAAEDSGPLVGRSMLCSAVGEWASRRGERVRVVFDGPSPGKERAKQIADSRLQVTYSGGVSADAALIGILNTDSAARRLLVVSSDREIVRAAKRRRARPIRSDEFWALVKQDLSRPPSKSPEPVEKKQGLDAERTEEWVREFGLERPEAVPTDDDTTDPNDGGDVKE